MLVTLRRLLALSFALAVFAVSAFAEEPDNGPNLPAQAAADVLREFTHADGAFLAAGLLKQSAKTDPLSAVLAIPTDTVAVLSLTGAQIRKSIERSLSLYPQPSPFFLQLSGIDVTFKKSAPVGARVVSISIGDANLDDNRTYSIAVPLSLANGGHGYFKIWQRPAISRNLDTTTLESVLKGKAYFETKPRYTGIE